jgi:hypothetical protein
LASVLYNGRRVLRFMPPDPCPTNAASCPIRHLRIPTFSDIGLVRLVSDLLSPRRTCSVRVGLGLFSSEFIYPILSFAQPCSSPLKSSPLCSALCSLSSRAIAPCYLVRSSLAKHQSSSSDSIVRISDKHPVLRHSLRHSLQLPTTQFRPCAPSTSNFQAIYLLFVSQLHQPKPTLHIRIFSQLSVAQTDDSAPSTTHPSLSSSL